MATETASERAAAMRLAGAGDFPGAIGMMRRLAEASGDPEDRLALGRMAYLATDYTEAQAQLEAAYREFQARGQPAVRPPRRRRWAVSTSTGSRIRQSDGAGSHAPCACSSARGRAWKWDTRSLR